MSLSTTFTQYAPDITKFGKITQNKGISPFKVIQVTDFGTSIPKLKIAIFRHP